MPIFLVDRNGTPTTNSNPDPTPTPPTPYQITILDHYLPDDTHNLYDITIDSTLTIRTLLTSSPPHVESWLLQIQNLNLPSPTTIGLDIEWRPNTQRGYTNPTATLQLCINTHCLVYQIIHSPYIPTSLISFLSNANNRFVGVGIEADVEKLLEDYNLNVTNFVDLRNLAADVYDDREMLRTGIKSLAERVLGKVIEKPQRITRSRWDNPWLNEHQVKYATIDAFVSFEVASRLYSHRVIE